MLAYIDYQTSQFFTGFIGDPSGHWKSLANSFRLLKGPSTRNWFGGCVSVVIWSLIISAKQFIYLWNQFENARHKKTFTWLRNRAICLSCWYPKHLLRSKIQTGQHRFMSILLYPFLICQICFLDAAIVGNILSLCVDAIELINERKSVILL